MPLRLIFMGTPEFSVPTLEDILAAGHDVAAVYTQPPRAAGRGLAARMSAVHRVADEANIPVVTPTSLKAEAAQQIFANYRADAAVVVAYGLVLPRPVLDAPRLGCYNLHASALPRWRGAAPIQRAIMSGDRATAATIMRIEEGLDTGPVCLEEPIAIPFDMTAGELHDIVALRGAKLMTRALHELENGSLTLKPQPDSGVTYAAKIDKPETRIDFSRSAIEVHNQVRGLSPLPGAWFEAEGPGGRMERIKVLKSIVVPGEGQPGQVNDGQVSVACGFGAVRFLTLQRAGRRPAAAEEFLRGFPLAKGRSIASI